MGRFGVSERVPDTGIVEETRQDVREPRLFRVLMHNDHFTTMEFVVGVLREVFGKPALEAVGIMLSIHHKGIGVCGVYPAEVAEAKVCAVHQTARDHGFPLRCSMEPE